MINLSATTAHNEMPLRPSAVRATIAYLLSVTTAAIAIIAPVFPHVVEQRASTGLLYPLWRTFFVLLSDCVFAVVVWVPAAFFSALPCALLNLLACWYSIRNPVFYVLMGCSVALLAVPPLISTTAGWTWYTDSPNPPALRTFSQEFRAIANVFVVAGAIAGLTYWFAAGRHFPRRSA
jgi:hypothetical protein